MFDTQSILDAISEGLDEGYNTLEGVVDEYLDDYFIYYDEATKAIKSFSDSDKLMEAKDVDFSDGELGAVRYAAQYELENGGPVDFTYQLDDPCYIANTILYINASIIIEKIAEYLSDGDNMVFYDTELTPNQIKQVQGLTAEELN
jgi:hypothetical protein